MGSHGARQNPTTAVVACKAVNLSSNATEQTGAMDRDTLRSIQRPLKDRYRAEPDAALVDVSGTVSAEGDLDFRGTLGLDPSVPVGFTSIRLTFDLGDSGGNGFERPQSRGETSKGHFRSPWPANRGTGTCISPGFSRRRGLL